MDDIAICCMSGGYKNVFTHGVLRAFEEKGISFDLFSDEEVPARINDSTIRFIKPDHDLKEMGVDFYTIAGNGLEDVYNHGREKGLSF
ncbi:hypothetical protein [uncultured Bacteroides sp.]|uniref:hypothetical protein n=1 Tax=uncultured Bacteroides sp. TaxID=162156 RepID=UPI000ACF9DE4|nr:hypothetical protein [uncultured Bacteroides sp.]